MWKIGVVITLTAVAAHRPQQQQQQQVPRRQAIAAAGTTVAVGNSRVAVAEDAIRATDRRGAAVIASKWIEEHAGRSDLVAGLDGEPYILLTEDGKLLDYALKAECTHLGCLVGPLDPVRKRFVCPCHGSEYDRTGTVMRGPAPKSLKLARVEVEADNVFLSRWTAPDFRENGSAST